MTDYIGSNMLSLLLVVSNDISFIKILGASVIYFIHSSNIVDCTYPRLAQLEKFDASSIATVFKIAGK